MDHFKPQTVGAVHVKRRRRLRRKGTLTRHRMNKMKEAGPAPDAKVGCGECGGALGVPRPKPTLDEQFGSSSIKANFQALGQPLPYSVVLWLTDDGTG